MIKPMKAAKGIDLARVPLPCYASPKLDGIRARIHRVDGEMRFVSKAGKVLPNKAMQSMLKGQKWLQGLEGELVIVAADSRLRAFNDIVSAVKTEDSPVPTGFAFEVFDIATVETEFMPFVERRNVIDKLCRAHGNGWIFPVRQVHVGSHTLLLHLYDEWSRDFEGMMTRSPHYHYIRGQASMEGLAKWKEWHDMEVTIIDSIEEMSKDNEPKGTLGALRCSMPDGKEVKPGSGFSAQERADLWQIRHTLPGKQITIKYQELTSHGIPRFPIFQRFRDDVTK